ncbi:MAG: hypothetical protein C0598_08450 [Marinilabiliales bacterium]|nr:MAG: hypothetical protein C0598_08450 [Marinilabiliales bacterium]
MLVNSGFSQKDTTILNPDYPFIVGNVGFAVDSLETVLGDLPKGEVYDFNIDIKNFGDRSINFRSGKSSNFIDLEYLPEQLAPGQKGIMNVKFNVIRELPPGEMSVEVVVESDDKESPFKFLYLLANISEDPSLYEKKTVIDTVPRLIFDHYNYDFGHLKKGKTVYHAFLFTNMGSKDLVIESIETSPGCKVVGIPNEYIPSEENGSIVVRMTFITNYGVQHHSVTVRTNDPVHPEIILGIHGSVYQKSPATRDPGFCIED